MSTFQKDTKQPVAAAKTDGAATGTSLGHLHVTPVANRVSVLTKIAYGSGGLTDFFFLNVILGLAVNIFSVGMKMDPALLGIALAIPRLVGAFADPFMGTMSDNTVPLSGAAALTSLSGVSSGGFYSRLSGSRQAVRRTPCSFGWQSPSLFSLLPIRPTRFRIMPWASNSRPITMSGQA